MKQSICTRCLPVVNIITFPSHTVGLFIYGYISVASLAEFISHVTTSGAGANNRNPMPMETTFYSYVILKPKRYFMSIPAVECPWPLDVREWFALVCGYVAGVAILREKGGKPGGVLSIEFSSIEFLPRLCSTNCTKCSTFTTI